MRLASSLLVVLVVACGSSESSGPAPKAEVAVDATVKVVAKRWAWAFQYEGGVEAEELHLAQDRATALELTSLDVIHTLTIPELRIRTEIVPGRWARVVIPAGVTALTIGCAIACGMPERGMSARVVVEPAAKVQSWLAAAAAPPARPPAEVGREVYDRRGCAACHSLDGSARVGPSWKGVWGSTVTLADGRAVVVDEAYVRESILAPHQAVVAGYGPSMPSYAGQLTDAEIAGVIALLQTLR